MIRRRNSTTWRVAKEALVAIMIEGVGPGVKMEEMRSAKKVAMVIWEDAVDTRSRRSYIFGTASQKAHEPMRNTIKFWMDPL